MIHTNNPIIKHKAGLLNLTKELGNVSSPNIARTQDGRLIFSKFDAKLWN